MNFSHKDKKSYQFYRGTIIDRNIVENPLGYVEIL